MFVICVDLYDLAVFGTIIIEENTTTIVNKTHYIFFIFFISLSPFDFFRFLPYVLIISQYNQFGCRYLKCETVRQCTLFNYMSKKQNSFATNYRVKLKKQLYFNSPK